MKRQNKLNFLLLVFIFLLSGCVVRTYESTKDRIDQNLTSGNRGYLKGQAPYSEPKPRKVSRSTRVVEVELHSPIKFEKVKSPKIQEKAAIRKSDDSQVWGNRGYITQSESPDILEPVIPVEAVKTQKYIVQKGDTLQKISEKYYGTTKKWTKIYDANKDILKGPNSIYLGQAINIPGEVSEDLTENLK
ncbi:LysM peptidoglycan-binding domain-containing protein [bacterium]|nr:MAG: LysM peptidoglycan-binding domain-containing protein [bacterium]